MTPPFSRRSRSACLPRLCPLGGASRRSWRHLGLTCWFAPSNPPCPGPSPARLNPGGGTPPSRPEGGTGYAGAGSAIPSPST